MTPQTALFADCLAPKQITTPEYAFVVNYAYHLDAGKFAELLRRHCTEHLGVKHVKANVSQVNSAENGDIRSVTTDRAGEIAGDLFIDCTGASSLLLGEHFEVPFQSQQAYLFNDTALAAQVPYYRRRTRQSSPARTQRRRRRAGSGISDYRRAGGSGHVYSSANISRRMRPPLSCWLTSKKLPETRQRPDAAPRKIRFQPGHRREFWHRNCVAIGMSSGFIEPLEASALVMIELAAGMIADQLPPTREMMDIVARRYNRKFLRHWNQIIEFLKLHYVLSARNDSPYWQDNQLPAVHSGMPRRKTPAMAPSLSLAPGCGSRSMTCFPSPAISTSCTAWVSGPSLDRPAPTSMTAARRQSYFGRMLLGQRNFTRQCRATGNY